MKGKHHSQQEGKGVSLLPALTTSWALLAFSLSAPCPPDMIIIPQTQGFVNT